MHPCDWRAPRYLRMKDRRFWSACARVTDKRVDRVSGTLLLPSLCSKPPNPNLSTIPSYPVSCRRGFLDFSNCACCQI
uniref:Uncharacterized protein n=1 Tax=Anguilla anguilla TaxID=7936 RepID=A0A0E9WZ25_ANGAN